MKKKKTTLSDIAKELNLTVATVSRALNNNPRISSSTKATVHEIAKKLNYQPNNIASALRYGKSNIVGVIVPATDRIFFASVIRGIEEVLRNEGYHLIICQSDEQANKEQVIIDTLLQIRVDGIIASVAKETEDFTYYEKIKNWQVPLILYDRIGDELGVSSVVNDDYQGAFKAVTHLIEQGCKKIAHFAGQQHIKIYRDRFKGYLDALKEHNLEINEQFIIESDLIDEPNIILEAGYEMTNRLLGCEDPPDGIFSSSDFAAMGAIKALKKTGMAIPHEVALVGFSNDFASSVIDPGLSSLDQHTKQMGIQAAKLFLEEVNNPNERFSARSIVLEPKLIIRESSNIYKDSKVDML